MRAAFLPLGSGRPSASAEAPVRGRDRASGTLRATPRPRAAWRTLAQELPLDRVPRLGELLVQRGLLSADQLAQALARQRRTGRRLGVELVNAGLVDRRHVRHALWLQRWLALTAFSTVVAIAATDSRDALAGNARGEISVSAIVPAVAVLQVEHQQAELTLTAADVARGYIDVPAASRLAIRTTSRSGCMLDFHPRLALFKSVSVSSTLGGGDLGPDGGTLVARGTTGRVAADVNYRFHLDGDVRPGAYPWPLAVSVRPL
jgi:hypothetical protein